MSPIQLTPATYACKEHGKGDVITPLVRAKVISQLSSFGISGDGFRVVVTCPGAAGSPSHPLTFTGRVSR